MPLAGLKKTLFKVLLADQVRPLCRESPLSVARHVQLPSSFLVQSVFALKLDGLTNTSAGGVVQLHVALAIFVGPVKLKVALSRQLVSGIRMFTFTLCPGSSVP